MILYKFHKKDEPVTYFNTCTPIAIPETYKSKDVRAMWVSNVLNIDLPRVNDVSLYQKSILDMLKTAKSFQINTLYFQVRTTNDAFYQSKLNPYSRYFTGKEGDAPPLDVLKWVIEQTKLHGISFHAWLNPYRVSMEKNMSKNEYLETCDDLNFAKKYPEHVMVDGYGKLILNPTRTQVKKHILDTVEELITTYLVDGIHYDDYFYPYGGLSEHDNDLVDFDQRDDKQMTLGDFRRHHVNDIIKGTYDVVKKYNSHLKFGVSPFAIWKNKTDTQPDGSHTDPKCSQSYHDQYADALHWVKNEYIDYIVPQIYWEFEHLIAPFADVLHFWVDACKDTKVSLYIGHGAYRLGNEGAYENPYEIVNQMLYASQYDMVKGHVFFTYHTFINQDKHKPGILKVYELLNRGEVT